MPPKKMPPPPTLHEKRVVKPTAKVAAQAELPAAPVGRSLAASATAAVAPAGAALSGNSVEERERVRGINWPDLATSMLIKIYSEMEGAFQNKTQRATDVWDEFS